TGRCPSAEKRDPPPHRRSREGAARPWPVVVGRYSRRRDRELSARGPQGGVLCRPHRIGHARKPKDDKVIAIEPTTVAARDATGIIDCGGIEPVPVLAKAHALPPVFSPVILAQDPAAKSALSIENDDVSAPCRQLMGGAHPGGAGANHRK